MNKRKSLLSYMAESLDQWRADCWQAGEHGVELPPKRSGNLARWFIPNIGTVLVVIVLLLTVPSLAAPTVELEAASTQTISYQGRLADSAGSSLTGYYNLEFRIYDVPEGGVPLWEELWTGGNSVQVSDGLFNVMLGSINNTLASAIEGHEELYLGITVGTDSEMVPRVQLGSVPFSMQAMTVPDGSISTAKLADGAVTQAKLGDDIVLVPPYEGFSYYTTGYFKPAGWRPIIVDTLNYNTFGTGTYNTSTGTFTAPKAGYYRFMTYGFIATAGVNNERIAIGISGSTTSISGGQFSAGDTPGPHASHVMYLDAGQSVSLSSYTPIDCTFGGTYPWWFQGEYLGE